MKQNYFLSQPHQPFFALGFFNAIAVMLLFALNYKGILSLEVDMLTFHSYSLIFLVFSNMFTGFLFTTFPRFNQTEVIDKKYYTTLFYLNTIASLGFIAGALIVENLFFASMLLLFISQLFIVKKLHQIYQSGRVADKSDSFWILIANYFGLLGNILFLISHYLPQVLNFAINISFYLYLIFLAFSVGQRMIPFFSHSFAAKDEKFVSIVFVLFLLKTLTSSLDIKVLSIIVDLLLAIYLLREFLRWDLHPFSSPAILWVLHLALFWLPTAFFISALTSSAELFLDTDFYYLGVHLLALGFLTTVLIGFGTRVTLGHGGRVPDADKITTGLFILIQLLVLGRTLFSINIALGWNMNFLFDISFTLWLVLFCGWGIKYGKILLFKKEN